MPAFQGEIPETEEDTYFFIQAWDEVSGKFLDACGVVAARQLEMAHVHLKKVWRKKDGSEPRREGYNSVGTRWIDVDKGDTENQTTEIGWWPKEYNTGQEGGLFASTPPLEALRWLLNEAATVGIVADSTE